jgi:predicted flap endonuclease-1-like 5' DNA nuclease/uncharacterized membrane protein YhaH (DUF805 family)
MARSPAKRLFGSLLFFVATVAVLGFAFLLYADAINDDTIPLSDETRAVGLVVAIALGVVAIALFIMLVTRRWADRAEAAESAEVFFIPETPRATPAPTTEFEQASEVTLYDLTKVPVGRRSWSLPEADGKQQPFYFPQSVAGGIYVNDYIPIDAQGQLLKLRTLMGGPYNALFALEDTPRRRAAPAPQPSRPARAVAVSDRQLVLQEVPVQEAEAVAPESTETFYVDYPGDNHEVEDLEGIGPTYGQRLRDAGVHTTARLAYEDTGALAEKLQVPRGTVEAWKQMAELVKVKGIGPQYAEALVRAGIAGIAELKRRSPARVAQQVNDYLASLDSNVLGSKITEKRVEGWKEAAKQLKRVRLQVPAN